MRFRYPDCRRAGTLDAYHRCMTVGSRQRQLTVGREHQRSAPRLRLVRLLLVATILGAAASVVAFFVLVDLDSPSLSLVPSLPADVEVVQNVTDYNGRAGGVSDRALVLRSSTRSNEELIRGVASAFGADSSWIATNDREWALREQPAKRCTFATVSIEGPGEILLAEDSLRLDQQSVVVVLTTSQFGCSNGFQMPGGR